MDIARPRLSLSAESLEALAVWLHYCTLSAIIFVGGYLRLTALGRQSLWFDEADIVVRAQRPMRDVLATFTTDGENGPLYNLLLALWVRVAGISEMAVRFPSALAGLLAIPAIYLLTRRLAGGQAGLVAAGLLAISPYHLWYSQEAKMYSIVVLLTILSTYLLIDALERGRRLTWIAYVVATTAMFYFHVASVLVFVAQALFVALTFQTWSRRWKAIGLAAAALTVPYLPIAAWALRVVGGEVTTWHADISLVEALKTVGIKFATFRSRPEIEFRSGWIYFVLAAGGGLWLLVDRRRRELGILLVSLALVPIVGLYALSLRNSVFSDRYIIVALPAYLILIALALVALSSSKLGTAPAALAAIALLAFTWVPLEEVNRASIAQKEDWRSAYTLVAEGADPNDVFILHPGYMISTLAYYGQRDDRLGGHPVATIPSFAPDWMTRDVMVEMLREDHGGSRRFWLIESPDRVPFEDPDDELERWLLETGEVLYEHQVNGVRLLLVELPPGW
jgi:uncharacterized membrane protein